jgi:hypothetical protein
MSFVVFLFVIILSGQSLAAVTICDVNNDGVIDRNDVNLITLARGKPVSSLPGADADGDGAITVLDARKCTLAAAFSTVQLQPISLSAIQSTTAHQLLGRT